MTGHAKRFAVTLVGGVLVLLGLALMPLPGPGILVVVVGLTVLATEYAWARRLLDRTRDRAEQAQRAAVASRPRFVLSLVGALAMIAVGVGVIVFDELPLTSPLAGSMIIIGGVILFTTSVLTYLNSRGEQTTYIHDDPPRPSAAGATAAEPNPTTHRTQR